MAKIDITEIEGLIQVENDYFHGQAQSVLTFLGVPVLFGPSHLTEDRDAREEVEIEFRQRIAGVLASLLLAQGNLRDWQNEPFHD
jgi:hypothetical protein